MPLTSMELYLFKPAEDIPQILMTHYKFEGPVAKRHMLGFKIDTFF